MKTTAILGSVMSALTAAAARSVPVFLALVAMLIVMTVAFVFVLGDNRRARNLTNLVHGPQKPAKKKRRRRPK